MHQITRGSGKPLLLIHGVGSSWRAWRPILDDLAAERSVIAIDLPGHGETPAEPDSGTFEGLVGSVERYLVANDLVGVDVVGSSMGARIVLELARRGKVGNVVALDPGGFWRGWERSFFHTTIGVSAQLLRALRSLLPALSRSGAARMALLAQLSAKPAALSPDLVCTELNSIIDTPTFDALVRDLANGPGNSGVPRLIRRSASSSVGADKTGSACPVRPTARKRRSRQRRCTGLRTAVTFRCGTCRGKRLRSSCGLRTKIVSRFHGKGHWTTDPRQTFSESRTDLRMIRSLGSRRAAAGVITARL